MQTHPSLLCCPHPSPSLLRLSPVPALLHFLHVFPLAGPQASSPHPGRLLLQPQGIAVLLQRHEGAAHHPQVVFIPLAGLGAGPQLRCRVFAGLGLSIQLSLCNELQRETEQSVGEVRVLFGNTGIHAGVRGLEGADQQTSICAYHAIIRPDLAHRKRRVRASSPRKRSTA